MHLFFTILASALTILSSPDKKIQVEITSDENSAVYYSVQYDGAKLLENSPLGLVTNEADYSKLELKSVDTETIRVNYELATIKKSKVDHEANRSVLHFVNPDGRPLDIEFHISNNDLAYRYTVLRDSETGSVRVMKELSGFNLPAGTTTYLTPQSNPMQGWKRTTPSYEEYYTPDAPVGQRSRFGHGFTFPCLFKVADEGWVLVSETGVDSRYCASHLSDPVDNLYTIAFPMPEENNGNGTIEPAFSLPGNTPWRTISVGRDIKPIVETTIPWDVVEPLYESKHDYNYGKSTWSWIVWQDASINNEDIRKFIDLAAAMGYPYTLIDAAWDVNIGREGMKAVVEYGRERGVDIFLWYSSSGWWNDITQSPVNAMSDYILRKKEMDWLEETGIKGIKVDFFGGDKQETMRHYESILSDADDHGLMVIFHGCTLPRGWERMYPNYVGSEAVRASENLIFNQHDCDIEAVSATLHPFIRNTVGCMEYGGTFLNKRMHKSNERGNFRRTTDAFQLALAVLFQNPVQNFALTPNNLEDAPALALDFMREVPTTWDEVRYIDGEPGKTAVIARRHADKWYISAINAEETPLSLDIDAIRNEFGNNLRVLATVKDNLSEVKLKAKKNKPISIAKNDGAVVIVSL